MPALRGQLIENLRLPYPSGVGDVITDEDESCMVPHAPGIAA